MNVVIPARFRGPPGSANGGYVCGLVASLVGGSAEVTLRSPPPLDTPLEVERSGVLVRLSADGKLVAEGRPGAPDLDPPSAPSFAEAEAASSRYPWRAQHPYPSCFVCGPERTPGDGLCIYPGLVEGRELAAAPFVPDPSLFGEDGRLREEVVWSALDCPSWFGFQCTQAFDENLVLLGRLSARIDERPRLGERCVSAGWFLGREGRKIHCGSALYSESGTVLAVARATWITLA